VDNVSAKPLRDSRIEVDVSVEERGLRCSARDGGAGSHCKGNGDKEGNTVRALLNSEEKSLETTKGEGRP